MYAEQEVLSFCPQLESQNPLSRTLLLPNRPYTYDGNDVRQHVSLRHLVQTSLERLRQQQCQARSTGWKKKVHKNLSQGQ